MPGVVWRRLDVDWSTPRSFWFGSGFDGPCTDEEQRTVLVTKRGRVIAAADVQCLDGQERAVWACGLVDGAACCGRWSGPPSSARRSSGSGGRRGGNGNEGGSRGSGTLTEPIYGSVHRGGVGLGLGSDAGPGLILGAGGSSGSGSSGGGTSSGGSGGGFGARSASDERRPRQPRALSDPAPVSELVTGSPAKLASLAIRKKYVKEGESAYNAFDF